MHALAMALCKAVTMVDFQVATVADPSHSQYMPAAVDYSKYNHVK